jgi:hypothetical protein
VCLDPPGLWSVPKYMCVCRGVLWMSKQPAIKQATASADLSPAVLTRRKRVVLFLVTRGFGGHGGGGSPYHSAFRRFLPAWAAVPTCWWGKCLESSFFPSAVVLCCLVVISLWFQEDSYSLKKYRISKIREAKPNL